MRLIAQYVSVSDVSIAGWPFFKAPTTLRPIRRLRQRQEDMLYLRFNVLSMQ